MNRALRISFGFAAVLALAAGCGKSKVNKVPQEQPSCADDGGHLNAVGECVQCVKNADCPVDQQCDLITGTCEPIPPPPPDAGPSATCQLGALRCAVDGQSVEECDAVDGGTAWQTQHACVSPQVCTNVPNVGPTCTICIPGETICDSSDASSTYSRCSDDGTEVQHLDCDADGGSGFCHQVNAHKDAADGGTPTAGLALCQVCQPGTSTCSTTADGGAAVAACDSTGSTLTLHSCYPTNACIIDSATAAHCKPFVCYPGNDRCAFTDGGIEASNTGNARQSCNGDGTAWTQNNCTGSDVCGTDPATSSPGQCLSACAVAEAAQSYVGCDYWGTLMSNTALSPAFTSESGGVSEYALVVGNTSNSLTAHVTVSALNGGGTYAQTVGPNSVGTVKLPWNEICGTGKAHAGYHLTSDVPVTVYQFNPLNSAIATSHSCSSNSSCAIYETSVDHFFCKNGKCNHGAFTDDASLLLPTHLLGTSYVVVAQDHESEQDDFGDSLPYPGEFSVVSTHDDTAVQIHFAGAAVSTASGGCSSVSGQGSLSTVSAGQTLQYTLNNGDVLQFWSASTGNKSCSGNINGDDSCLWANDLTGSIVTSVPGTDGTAKPIAVFGGADCTFKPYNKFACDHIEEEMFPYSTWGKKYVGVKSHNYAGSSGTYPDYWRIVSACGPSSCPNGATVTVTPAMGPARASSSCPSCSCVNNNNVTTCTLPPVGSGQTAPWVEFQHSGSFTANSDQPIVLAQYFVGEEEANSDVEGDPSLVLMPPVEQWRTNYTVLAPTTYAHNYVNLAVSDQASTTKVKVDGTTVTGWSQIASTGTYVAQWPLNNSGTGSHTIVTTGGAKVGAVVTGYDSYVSYGYTGGLDLHSINVVSPGG